MDDLLLTKLLPPRLPGSLIERPERLARLEEGWEKAVTLITAPTGFGKTTLVSQWLNDWNQPKPPGAAAEENTPAPAIAAWVTLEDSDNDPIRFWRYVIGAVQMRRPEIGRKALAMLRAAQVPAMESLLTSLLNDLALVEQPVCLVLDDFHRITAEEVLETFQFLLAHRPPNLHLIILARSEPRLPLALLRARGEIHELTAENLRFSESETAEFLRQALPFAHSPRFVQRLLEKTEGWAAGIRLVTLALRSRTPGTDGEDYAERFIEAFHGEHRFVLDYLHREVFQKLPGPARDFLLRTCLLHRISGPLCDWILDGTPEPGGSVKGCGAGRGAEMLAQLEQDGLFLTGLGSSGGCAWYHYQPLFAEAMRHEAQQALSSEEIRSIYRKASQWYRDNGLSEEAIDAALAAEEIEPALDLIEQFLEQRSFNEILILRRWCDQVPEAAVRRRPLIAFNYAQALLFSMDRYAPETAARVVPLLKAAEETWRSQKNQAGVGAVLAMLGVVDWWQGDLRPGFQLIHQALQALAETDVMWRGVVLLAMGTEAIMDGSLPEARRYLLESQALSGAANNIHSVLAARSLLGDIAYLEGELDQASLYHQQVLAQAVGGEEMLDDQSIAWLGLARVAYEQNDLSTAETHARQALDLGLRRDNETIWVPAQTLLAWIACHRGESARARASLASLLPRLRQEYVIRELLAALARLALSAGDLADALAWHARLAARPGQPFASQQAREMLLQARLEIAADQPEQELAGLKQCQAASRSQGRLRDEVEALLIQALAYDSLGDRPQALQVLTVALTLGQPVGFRRIFLDEGRPLERQLAEITAGYTNRPTGLYATALLHAFPPAQGSATGSPPRAGQPAGAPAHAMLVEPLSAQELRVLRLLAAGRSNPEIAEALVVSVNTVKTQVQSIYRKLNVRSRQEAGEAARAFNLI